VGAALRRRPCRAAARPGVLRPGAPPKVNVGSVALQRHQTNARDRADARAPRALVWCTRSSTEPTFTVTAGVRGSLSRRCRCATAGRHGAGDVGVVGFLVVPVSPCDTQAARKDPPCVSVGLVHPEQHGTNVHLCARGGGAPAPGEPPVPPAHPPGVRAAPAPPLTPPPRPSPR